MPNQLRSCGKQKAGRSPLHAVWPKAKGKPPAKPEAGCGQLAGNDPVRRLGGHCLRTFRSGVHSAQLPRSRMASGGQGERGWSRRTNASHGRTPLGAARYTTVRFGPREVVVGVEGPGCLSFSRANMHEKSFASMARFSRKQRHSFLAPAGVRPGTKRGNFDSLQSPVP